MTEEEQRIISAKTLGWTVPLPEAEWPQTFDWHGKTWTQEMLTVAENIHEVQCGVYNADDGSWVIVYNE